MSKIAIYKELTGDIIGCLYRAFNELGYGYREKYYQRNFEEQLKLRAIPYKKELSHRITAATGKIIGRYFIDFLIDDKVVVELKIANDFYSTHVNQLLSYLTAYDLKVGLLALMTPNGVKIKRLVN